MSSQTPDLQLTLEFAADEANRRRVGLALVHGCSPMFMATTRAPTAPPMRQEIRWHKRLDMLADRAVELLDQRGDVAVIVHPGTGVQALLEASSTASLVVLQRRQTSRRRRIRTGSTSAQVAVGAHAPVAILPGSAGSLPVPGDVVVGVDASDSFPPLSLAFSEAKLRRTGLLVVHAWRPKRTSLFVDGPAEEVEFRGQFGAAHQRLVDFLDPWTRRYPDVPVRSRLFTLPPVESLLLAASEGQLLVLGGHLGDVARRCLADASCPVLVATEGQRISGLRPGPSHTWDAARPTSRLGVSRVRAPGAGLAVGLRLEAPEP